MDKLAVLVVAVSCLVSCTCLRPVDECAPLTCADQGKDCGTLSDGCDHLLDCGGCAGLNFCGGSGPNLCGLHACQPTTCATLGAECGLVADGCASTIDCGTCTAPLVCGAPGRANRCVPPNTTCTPKTCAELAIECGPADDGCSNALDCSTCTDRLTCAGGRCTCTDCSNVWSTLGGDIGHTGFNAAEQGTPPLTLRWTSSLPAVDPVVADGLRVFATSYKLLTTLDAADGGVQWTHSFPTAFAVGQPAVFDGQVYVAHCNHESDTKLWAFDAPSGGITFAVAMSAQWDKYWAPVKVGNGVYTNGGSHGGLYGFDATTGANLFFNPSLAQYDEWSPASDGTRVYAFVGGHFVALNAQTGVQDWDLMLTWNWPGWAMRSSTVIASGMAFVIAPPTLYAIDLSTHSVRWSASLSYTGTPAVSKGVVYAVNAGNIRAEDQATGAHLWTFVGDGALSFPPVLTSTHLYAASNNHVYAVDLASHTQVWMAPGGGWLSLAAGSLYVAGNTLKAYSLTAP